MERMLDELNARVTAALVPTGIGSLLDGADAVIVGYSGGADSSFLLHYLRVTSPGGRLIVGAHLHHGIRGAEADRDEAFCREQCRRTGVRFFAEHADVPALAAAAGESLETAARRARYAFFDRAEGALRREGRQHILIATAHTADDNLETVLFHLLRGSGTCGLGGIPPVRDGRLIRPLLCLGGEEIRQACRAAALPFVTDSSNGDERYTRNYLRKTVVPALRRVVPSPETAVSRSAANCRSDEDCLRALAQAALDGAAGSAAPRALLREQHPAVRVRMLELLYRRAFPSGRSLEKVHLDAMMAALEQPDGWSGSLNLPGGAVFRLSGGTAEVVRGGEPAIPFEEPLLPEQRLSVPGYRVFAGILPECEKNIYKLSIQATLRFDTMEKPMTVRCRRPGDVYRLGGMTRQVRKMLSEQKLSTEERQRLPLLCLGKQVIWVPGFAPADGFRDGSQALPVYVLRERDDNQGDSDDNQDKGE